MDLGLDEIKQSIRALSPMSLDAAGALLDMGKSVLDMADVTAKELLRASVDAQLGLVDDGTPPDGQSARDSDRELNNVLHLRALSSSNAEFDDPLNGSDANAVRSNVSACLDELQKVANGIDTDAGQVISDTIRQTLAKFPRALAHTAGEAAAGAANAAGASLWALLSTFVENSPLVALAIAGAIYVLYKVEK